MDNFHPFDFFFWPLALTAMAFVLWMSFLGAR